MFVRRKYIRNLVQKFLIEHGITAPPVDVKRIAERLGLEVRKHKADPDLSGFLLRDSAKAVSIVGVNSRQHPNRQRFTIAHEIAHFVLHPGDSVHVDKVYELKLRDAKSSEGVDLEEKEANLFAAELLMPAHFIAEDMASMGAVDLFDSNSRIKELAKKYEVSPEALGFRLAYLGYS